MGLSYKGSNFHAFHGYYLEKMINKDKHLSLLCYRNNFLLKKIMDAWEASRTVELLYRFLYIRLENIVHMVTDNASNYVVASELLMEEFPSISWSSCIAYYINLILQKKLVNCS
jgi:hypothetical protein